MDVTNLFEFARKCHILAAFSEEETKSFFSIAELKSVRAGEVIFEQGETGNKFFLIYNGKIRIIRKAEDGKELNLGVFGKYEHFGEAALITDTVRVATARAVDDSVLLVVQKPDFIDFLFSKPHLREYFDRTLKFASISLFLKTCSKLAPVAPKELQELSKNFTPEFFKAGEVVFRQGTNGDKFYLVEKGKLKVERWENKESAIINFLREGEFFGELALIEETPRHADVVCLSDCHLFSLSKASFVNLIKKSDNIKKVIEDRIKSYSAKPPIPYEEIIKQELAVDKAMPISEPSSCFEQPSGVFKLPFLKRFSSLFHRYFHFPFAMQHDEMSCGPTCLMMIAKFYGKTISSNRIRDLSHVDASGCSLANLADAAEQLGFSTRALKVKFEALINLPMPCISHWQGYHFVVVYKASKKSVWIADPAIGLRKISRDDFCQNWNGITLVVEPTPEFEKQNEDPSTVRNFIYFVKPYWFILFEVFLASLLLNLLGLTQPIFTQNIIDKVLVHQNVSMLHMMLAGMILVLIFRLMTTIIRQYLIIHTTMKIDLAMLVSFYRHLLSLPMRYFKTRRVGDFVSRFGENLKIRRFLTETAMNLVLDLLLIAIYTTVMFLYNFQLSVVVFAFIPIFIIITIVSTPIFKRLNMESFAARAESESLLIESIHGIDTIKTMNSEKSVRWKWENKFIKSLNIDFSMFQTEMAFNTVSDFFGTVSSTVILWYGAQLVMSGSMSVGQLMGFMSLVGSVISPILNIIRIWDSLQQVMVSVDRLNDVYTAKSEYVEDVSRRTGILLHECKGEISFEKVFFRYGGKDEPYILSNISLKISPGKKVAIVGRSGSGKSTLVRLVSRLYEPSEGKIVIDGYDIRTVQLSMLRRLVGYVLQDNFIFNATIRENVSLGDPEESLDKIIESNKLANSHDFIMKLPQGYETKVGESGLQLSGGQKQRIAIARALYHDPRILIFDEATSSLDTESEQAIQKNFDAILKDKTAIIIAHRLSTVRNADLILVLDNGEIIEQGTHEELMAKTGLYHYLNHQQLHVS